MAEKEKNSHNSFKRDFTKIKSPSTWKWAEKGGTSSTPCMTVGKKTNRDD